MEITGGCRCRAVRYVLREAPIASRVCWCRDCQYFASGSGTVNLGFRIDTLEITGTPADFASVADSGNRMHRRFCRDCGTQLFSASEARPHLTFVRAGSLDDPELARPSSTIWLASAPSWACTDDALPKYDGQPPPIG